MKPTDMCETPEKNVRIVIVGSGGRLGSTMMDFFGRDHQVLGFDHAALDLADPGMIDSVLGGLDFDHLFLAGALTAVDYCETHAEEAHAVNARGPGRIAEICAGKGARLTYISTDMVFDGLKGGPYVESDEARPVSVYGASKLEGERRVMAASSGHLVARISWVFGPARPAFPEWIIQQAASGKQLTLPANKICSPTSTLDLVEWLDALVFRRDASGIYHLCNSGACTWRDWGQYCIDVAREAGLPLPAVDITGIPLDSVEAFVAKRPPNSSMDTARFTGLTGFQPRPWREAIRDHVMQNVAGRGHH
jgi:dTDP-4-dehydrorhamnose reductase